MREKILAELRKKYPGLPIQFLGLWADKLGTKVTEEAQIEGVINELENLPVSLQDLGAEFQREGDRRVKTAEVEWKKKNPLKKQDKTDDSTETTESVTSNEDTPAWAKKQLEIISTLTEKIQKLETQDQKKTLSEKLINKLTERKIPLVLAKGKVIEKEEDLDAIVAEIEADHTAYKQALADEGFSQSQHRPVGGSGSGEKKASKEEVEEVVKNIM